MKDLIRSAAAAVVILAGAQANAAIIVNITSPTPNTRVSAGQNVVIGFTAHNAVAGLSTITITGERDSPTVISGFAPNTNSFSSTAIYTIPLDVLDDEELTVSVTATGVADTPETSTLTLLGPVGVPAPANDDLANCQVIAGDTGTVNGTNAGASKETNEANHAANSGGRSVWYCWTAPGDGEVTIDTVGSDFDTTLATYLGSVHPLSPVTNGSNDDTVGVTSSVTIDVNDGSVYRIAVDGFNGGSGAATGNVTLNWDFQAASAASPVWTMYE